MTKAFYIVGIIGALLFISTFLGYMGYDYTGMTNYETGTAVLPTTLISATFSGFGFIFGALTFHITNVPVFVTLIIWLLTLALIWMIIELFRGI